MQPSLRNQERNGSQPIISLRSTSQENNTSRSARNAWSLKRQRNIAHNNEGNELPMLERRVVKALAKQQGDRSQNETRMLIEFFTEASCFKELDIK